MFDFDNKNIMIFTTKEKPRSSLSGLIFDFLLIEENGLNYDYRLSRRMQGMLGYIQYTVIFFFSVHF